jgi:hypothetical protein
MFGAYRTLRCWYGDRWECWPAVGQLILFGADAGNIEGRLEKRQIKIAKYEESEKSLAADSYLAATRLRATAEVS